MANSISGTLGVAGSGARVYCIGALNGGTGTFTLQSVVADGSGNYSLTSLPNGSYQVTPYLAGYTFTPAFSKQTISGNVSGLNFTPAAIGQTGVWHRQGIVIEPNHTDESTGTEGIEEITVLYETGAQIISPNGDGKVFKMWFAGGIHVYYAESNDGWNWTRQAAAVFATQLGNPRVFHYGSTYYLTCTTGSYLGGNIDLYTSATGTTFTLSHSSILTPGAANTWDSAAIWDMTIVEVDGGGTWHAMYTGAVGNQFNSGHATSPDGVTWTKDAANPVLPNQFSNFVIKVASTYYAWGSTAVFVGNGTQPYGIPTEGGFASSADYATWTGTSNVFQRTLANEGVGTAGGQTGTYGSLVEVSGKTYWFYTTSPVGTDAHLFNVQLAIYNGTLAQLVATNQQVYIPPTSPLAIRNQNSNTGGTTQNPTVALNVVAGDLIVVAIRAGGTATTITSVTDNAAGGSNTYVSLTGTSIAAQLGISQLWYVKNAKGGTPLTITAAMSASSANHGVYAWDISGADLTAPLVAQATGLGNGATFNGATTAKFTTTDLDVIVLAMTTDQALNINLQASGLGPAVADAIFPPTSSYAFALAQHALLQEARTNITASAMSPNTQGYFSIVSGAFKAATYGISGSVGVAGAGATITLSGNATGSTTADGSGNYAFTGLQNLGTYTITPSLAGYTFSPTSANETLASANITGVDFTTTPTAASASTGLPITYYGGDVD